MNIDELLNDTSVKSKIPLSATTEEVEVETYEEWVEIHGEPIKLISNINDIVIKDCTKDTPDEKIIDRTEIFYKDKFGNLHINYMKYASYYKEYNKCAYCNGQFYTPNGAVSVEEFRRDIAQDLLETQWAGKADTVVTSVINSLRDLSYIKNFEINRNLIPFANGDLIVSKNQNWEFKLGEKSLVPYRLSVDYTSTTKPAPLFNKWLHDVFEDEDIPTVQEILGYMLVPVTAAQEAFFLVGEGSVGKSVIGVIIGTILGNGCVSINTTDMAEKQFQIATAENKLVVYDDDVAENALTSTGVFKKLITADSPIPAERKFKDPYNFLPFCKVIGCANKMVSALYDDSDGFYRRLHPIKVKKPIPEDEKISGFGRLIVKEEIPQIVNWALEGLRRLMKNDWKVVWSKRSREYMGMIKNGAVHFPEFISETLDLGKGDISSKELQRLYERWCKENNVQETKTRRMQSWFNENAEKYQLQYSTNVIRNEKKVRGFLYASVKSEWKNLVNF